VIVRAIVLLLLVACAPPPPVIETRSRDLVVTTINVRNNEDWWEERLPLLADEIARLAPDVIGLQEVQISADQGLLLQEAIAARGIDYTYDDQLKVGLAEFLGEGIGAMFRGTRVERDVLPMTEGRVALFDRVDLGEGLLVDLYDTHLEAGDGSTGDGDELRRAQAEAIVAFMAERDDGHPRFLLGDMNATPEQPAIAEYAAAGLADAWVEAHGDDLGATSPVVMTKDPTVVQDFKRRIDYVLHDGPVVVQDAIVCFDAPTDEGLYPSDHLGVTATVTVEWEVEVER
jgi:endonuclease/exonuclease/phosphatase family metal-dependent hydrolase